MVSKLLSAACLVALSFVSSVYGHEQGFFSSTASMEVDWVAAAEDGVGDDVSSSVFNLDQINAFESAMSALLYESMTKESESSVGLLPSQEVLAVEMHVKNVTKKNHNNQFNNKKKNSTCHVESTVNVLYIAEVGIPDMASILIRLSRQENMTDAVGEELNDIAGGNTTARSVVVNFNTLEPPATMLWEIEEHSHTKQKVDQNLLLACTVLCAALVLVIAVLLYVAGGWHDLREQLVWIKDQRKTYSNDEEEGGDGDDEEESSGVDVADSQSYEGNDDDDDGDEDASHRSAGGIIGASSKEDNAAQGLGINRTPERGLNDDEDGYNTTPFSEMSQYTDTSRAPLGISSMRKMQQGGHQYRGNGNMMSLPPLAYQ